MEVELTVEPTCCEDAAAADDADDELPDDAVGVDPPDAVGVVWDVQPAKTTAIKTSMIAAIPIYDNFMVVLTRSMKESQTFTFQINQKAC